MEAMPAPLAVALDDVNEKWKRRFADLGLDLAAVWSPTPADPELENQQLRALWAWVQAYQACPDRSTLIRRGYLFPPIDPDIDPETDWLRFERWVRGEPLKWNYVIEHGLLPDADALTEEALRRLLDRVTEILGDHGVCIDASPAVPDRLLYAYLEQELVWTWFDICAPGTWCHIGCAGECEGCYQQPWCETAREVAGLSTGA